MIEGDPIEQAKASGFKVEITRKGSSQTPPPAPKQVSEILQTLQLLTPVDGVFEVRGVKPRPLSGYFDAEHLEEAARRIEALDESGASEGLYWTINEVNPALLSRRANRIEMRLAPGAPTTADADIVRRRWLLVDIDPDRPSGISSTDEEHKRALDMAGRVSGFLREFYGFPDPILADSGNGAHLMYRIDLPNDDESTTLITRCLKALGNAFNGHGCEIDQKVFNAARIGRLYGTVARKGDHTPERPHRRSKILEIPEIMKAVSRGALATLAALAQEEEQPRHEPRPRGGNAREIDLADWLREYGRGLPAYQEKPKPPWRYFYVFDTCPWDSSHRDRSAWVGQLSSGPLAAGCQHNGCSGKGWADLRALVDDQPKPAQSRKTKAPQPTAAPRPPAQEAEETKYDRFFSIVETKFGKFVALNYVEIAAHLRDEFAVLTFNKTIYLYDPATGLYIENVGQIENEVQAIAEEVGYKGKITEVKREVLSYVRDYAIETRYPFNQYPGIPVDNGVVQVNLATGEVRLEPYTPALRFTYKMPVVYDPAASPDAIDAVLRQWVEPVDVPLLYQIPAQALLHQLGRKKPYKKCYLFHGDQDAGKTTYLELLYCAIGAENCAGVALQRIGTDRFYKGALENKVLNTYDDLGDVPFSNTGTLKALTGGFEHDIERKGRDSYKGRIFAVHVFTCNKPPSVDDRNKTDSAFWSRWEYLTFPNSFPRDPSFHERMYTPENVSGYFNRVLETVVTIAQTGALLVDSSAYVVRDRWSFNSDPLYRFVQEHLEKNLKGAIPKDDLFDAYLRYCHAEEVDAAKIPVSKDAFAKKLFGYDFGTSKQTVEGTRVQMFTGYNWQVSSRFKPGGTDQSRIGDV